MLGGVIDKFFEVVKMVFGGFKNLVLVVIVMFSDGDNI